MTDRTVLLVGINYALTIVGIPPIIPYNVAYSFTFSTFAANGAVVFTQTGSLPTGITFTDNGDGTATLAGTTTDPGLFPITVQAIDATRLPVFRSFTLQVAIQPISVPNPNPTYTPGDPFTDYTPSGGIGPYNFTLDDGSLPPGITLNSDGTFSGTVTSGTTGHYCWTVTVDDTGGGAPEVTFTQCADLGSAPTWMDITAPTYWTSYSNPAPGQIGDDYTYTGSQWVLNSAYFVNSGLGTGLVPTSAAIAASASASGFRMTFETTQTIPPGATREIYFGYAGPSAAEDPSDDSGFDANNTTAGTSYGPLAVATFVPFASTGASSLIAVLYDLVGIPCPGYNITKIEILV